ncbi:cytochrome P450 [Candidatus Frankia nodulisporulans]|uniref:cytochrome P450 n=1 Tax=Candidatus Frankia nodulisporulans TaxID=2060052 RepID=UPI0013D0C869|nr:cytochrome P450 [Candidatus Frankia nodulisporulans]
MTDVWTTPEYMRRTLFGPGQELLEAQREGRLLPVTTPFGLNARIVTRYDEVRAILGDADRFGSFAGGFLASPVSATDATAAARAARATGVASATGTAEGVEGTAAAGGPHAGTLADLRAGNLLVLDPPDHTRLRRMLTPEFTGARMRRLQARVTEIIEDALDDVERAGRPVDLVPTFALAVPSLVICELLGVPYADRDAFHQRTARQIDVTLPVDERFAVVAESRAYMATLVDRARREPGEDTLGMLVREHGDELSTAELVGVANLLLIAGHETTANMFALGTLALLRHPEQLAAVRDDPAMTLPAVEELLRWLSIVHAAVPRTARDAGATFGGREVAPEDHLVVSLPAANRDPAFIDDPDRLDITRGAIGHVAFGFGRHHCLGAPLARMELRIGLPALLRRFPDLALAIPFEEVVFRTDTVVYGLQSLPVTF